MSLRSLALQLLQVLILLPLLAAAKEIKSITPRDANGNVDFAMALNMGDRKLIEQALADGADINQKGNGGQTPLLNSVLRDMAELVEILLDLGADPSIPEQDGYTVMDVAAFQGRADSLKVLAKHKLDPLIQHADGLYPLHRACRGEHKDHAKTVKIFLQMGVPLDLTAANGYTCEEMTTNEHTRRVINNYKKWLQKKNEAPAQHDEL